MRKAGKVISWVGTLVCVWAFLWFLFINEKAIVVAELTLIATFGALELVDYLIRKREKDEMAKKAERQVSEDK